MSATAKLVPDRQQDSAAQLVLENFLSDALRESVPSSDGPAGTQAETDLRTDILYALTDRIAYRRAWPLTRLIEEVRALQFSELAGPPLTDERVKASLHVLLQQRLVREFDTPAEKHYELAHDFLVRYVVRTYRELERRRISQLAILKQQQKATDVEFARLSRLGSAVSWLLRLLPILTFSLAIGWFIYAVTRTLPDLLGLSYLWVLALPGAALLLLGMAARRVPAISLGAVVLLCCAGTWLYEYSQPSIDIAHIYSISVPRQTDWCYDFAVSAASSLRTDISRYLNPCRNASQGSTDINVRNMIYNARGLHGMNFLSPDADFCFDVSEVFGQYTPMSACWQHTPDWSLYLAYAGDYQEYLSYSGVRVPRYQVGGLSSAAGWFTFFLLIAHFLFYPAVLRGTVENVTAANALRRVSSEIWDVVLTLAMLIGIKGLIISLSAGYFHWRYFSWGYVSYWRSDTQLVVVLLLHAVVYVGASAALSVRKRASIGMSLTKVRFTDLFGSSVIPIGKLISRAALLWVWSILNLFYGLPTFVITPLYVWLRKDHQLLYDSLLKLRTEPRHSTEKSDANAALSPWTTASAERTMTTA